VKRDLDLIRAILFKIESDGKVEIPGHYKNSEIADHAKLLEDGDLIDTFILPNRHGIAIGAGTGGLTWAGHNFLEKIRDEATWAKTKAYVMKHSPEWTIALLKVSVEHALQHHT
jgi:hypothetical protein